MYSSSEEDNSKVEPDPVFIPSIFKTDFSVSSDALCLLVSLSVVLTSTQVFYGILVNIFDLLAKQ